MRIWASADTCQATSVSDCKYSRSGRGSTDSTGELSLSITHVVNLYMSVTQQALPGITQLSHCSDSLLRS